MSAESFPQALKHHTNCFGPLHRYFTGRSIERVWHMQAWNPDCIGQSTGPLSVDIVLLCWQCSLELGALWFLTIFALLGAH